eukprot:Gb_25529 [translate_table: standard]
MGVNLKKMEQAIVPVLFQTEFDVKTEAFFVDAVGIHDFWNRETQQSECKAHASKSSDQRALAFLLFAQFKVWKEKYILSKLEEYTNAVCSRHQMEDEEGEEDGVTELWEESSLKTDFMEWTIDKAMAAFTCPLLGLCLVEQTAVFY